LPAINNVANQINGLGVVISQEIEKALGLTAARAEVDIGNKERTEPSCAGLKCHESPSRFVQLAPLVGSFDCSRMTAKVNGRRRQIGLRRNPPEWPVIATQPGSGDSGSLHRPFWLLAMAPLIRCESNSLWRRHRSDLEPGHRFVMPMGYMAQR
jgi:hypothetical protein